MNAIVGLDHGRRVRRSPTPSRTSSRELILNPLETVLTTSPWWLVIGLVSCVAGLVSGWRAATTAAICLLLIVGPRLCGARDGDAGHRSSSATAVTLRHRARGSGSSRPATGASRRCCGRSSTSPRRCRRSSICCRPSPCSGRAASRRSWPRSSSPSRRSSGSSRPASGGAHDDHRGGRVVRRNALASCSGRSSCRSRGRPSCSRANQGIVMVLAMVVVGAPRRAPARWATTSSPGSPRSRTSARASPRASRSSCWGSCSTGSRREPGTPPCACPGTVPTTTQVTRVLAERAERPLGLTRGAHERSRPGSCGADMVSPMGCRPSGRTGGAGGGQVRHGRAPARIARDSARVLTPAARSRSGPAASDGGAAQASGRAAARADGQHRDQPVGRLRGRRGGRRPASANQLGTRSPRRT